MKKDSKERYDRNRDKILENKKVYWNEKRDELLKKNTERREKNKEKYNQNRKDKRQQNNHIKFHCECGSVVNMIDKSNHLKTRKHQEYLENK